MKTYIGIDLGTSAAKLILADAEGIILNTVTKTYPVSYPHEGWSEQNPDDWLDAVKSGIGELLAENDSAEVKGIGAGGQMHGLVALDDDDRVIRPCILWNDGRTEKQTEYLNAHVGKNKLSSLTANIAFAGFTAPKLMWLKENEPENFARIKRIMLPKDYITYRLTGVHATDYSDAAGTLLLDVKNRRWSEDMCRLTGISASVLPTLFESYDKVGKLKSEYEKLWNVSDVWVCAGASDNAAAAIGTGTVDDGDCNISLGTSGTVFVAQNKFSVDSNNALHSFCHANGKFHLLGCILSAAACNGWWMNILNTDDYKTEQCGAEDMLGDNEVFFLPYLVGERSPHNDVNARGAFLGLTPVSTRKHMTLAVMEGVAFALNDCLERARENGLKISRTKICGGGAKSALWRKIIANVCNAEVQVPTIEEGPAYGAAILAMTACGEYETVSEACKKLCKTSDIILPDRKIVEKYAVKYKKFTELYPALKGVFNGK